jgi:hypothetical protein
VTFNGPMPPKKKGPGRPPKHGPVRKGARSGQRLTADLDPHVLRVLAAYTAGRLKKEGLKLSRTQVVEMALIRLFKEDGYWPK